MLASERIVRSFALVPFALSFACMDPGSENLCLDNPHDSPAITIENASNGSYVCNYLGNTYMPDVSLVLELDCTHVDDDSDTREITITTPIAHLPPALAGGGPFTLEIARGIDVGGTELDFLLTDDDGPLIAAAHYAWAPVDWGPLNASFDTDCDAEPGDPDMGSIHGFVRVVLESDDEVEVRVGEPAQLSHGSVAWDLWSSNAAISSAHGSPVYSVELVRR